MDNNYLDRVKKIINAAIVTNSADDAMMERVSHVCGLIVKITEMMGGEAVFASRDGYDLVVGFDCWDIIVENENKTVFASILKMVDTVKFFQIREDLVRAEFKLKGILKPEEPHE